MRRLRSFDSLLLLVICLPLLAGTTGCAVLYQLAYGDGHKIEAKFQGLKGKRVAVVCAMNSSMYGDGATSTIIAESVERILRQNVDEIILVRQDQVSDWRDSNDWDESDFNEIGRGVKADMVVGIEIESFRIHEPGSPTLLKGRAEMIISVYDITKGGEQVFRTTDRNYSFPQSHAIPAISEDPRVFQRTFIELVAQRIAKNFYDYDMAEDFAPDGAAYAH